MKKDRFINLIIILVSVPLSIVLSYFLTKVILWAEHLLYCKSSLDCTVWGQQDITMVVAFITWVALLFLFEVFGNLKSPKSKTNSRKFKKFLPLLIIVYLITLFITVNYFYIKTDSSAIYFSNKTIPWSNIKAIGSEIIYSGGRYRTTRCNPTTNKIVLVDDTLQNIPEWYSNDLSRYLMHEKKIPHIGTISGCFDKYFL